MRAALRLVYLVHVHGSEMKPHASFIMNLQSTLTRQDVTHVALPRTLISGLPRCQGSKSVHCYNPLAP